jgi:flavin reductase (DIM6/NTAB) family NADH-FMN oxidoreductase RutF
MVEEMNLRRAFTLIEPGPVVFITTYDGEKDNIMTISWTMVVDSAPKFAITTGSWNYSYASLRKQRECVIAIPTVDLIDQVVGVGTCSGADTDKFEKFRFTPVKGKHVSAPLIKECVANIECKVVDIIKKHDIVILEGVDAYFDTSRKEKRTFQLERIVSTMKRLRHIQEILACPKCKSKIVVAPKPEPPFPKSQAAPLGVLCSCIDISA